ncbi:MAG: SPOR domain-containing protein [Bacteroidota bacterium]
MKSFLCLLLVVATVSFSKAQAVVVKEDPQISRMMERMIEINRNQNQVEGWRIQILATTDRRKMEDAKSRFLANYPQLAVNWIHAKPFYKLRAGAFTSRLDAIRLLHELKRDYPSAYPAKDNNIEPRELIGGL